MLADGNRLARSPARRAFVANALLLTALLGGCRASDRVDASGSDCLSAAGRASLSPGGCVASNPVSGSALSYFQENAVTEIRYVRFPSYIGVADAKPVKILSVCGLSPRDDARTLALLDKADIGSWKACYEDDRVSDGMCWTVEVVSGDRVIKRVFGFNAEPPGLKYLLQAGGLCRRACDTADF